MTAADDEDERDSIAGLSIEEVIDRVAARQDAADETGIRQSLSHVAEDGIVSWEAAEDDLAHASKVVSTPETRLELASMELSEARETAEPVADLDVVRARLDGFESRLATVEDEVAALGEDLQALVERAGDRDDLFAVARELRAITEAANRAQGAADDLSVDVEEFERWVENPATRYRELEEDVGALERSIDELANGIDTHAEPAATGSGGATDEVDGVEAALRRRVLDLLVYDLRAELADLRAWPGEDDDEANRADEIEDRLGDCRSRLEAIGDRAEDVTDDRRRVVEDFDEAIAAIEPPVDWSQVETTLREHRARLDQDP